MTEVLGAGGFELNRAPEVTATFQLAPAIFLVDSTIRSLQSTVSGSRHTAVDLIEIGRAIDRLGVRELIVNLSWRDGLEVAEGLAQHRPAARVIGTFRARRPDAARLLEAGIDAGVDEICLESPPDRQSLESASERLREVGLDVSIAFAERHSWGEVIEFAQAAAKAGSRSLSFHDSYFHLGIHPEAMKEFVRRARSAVGDHPPLYVHLSNFYGQATMTAVAAVLAGATAIDCCLNQSGHHGGHISLAEVCMVLEDLYGIDTGIELGLITDVVAEVNERTGVPVPLTKPVIGSMAFMIDGADWAAEAHLPADERMHSRLPFSPSHVGARSMMVWSDRTAGEEAVAIKLGVMGLPASPEATRTALALLSDAVHDRKAYPAWLTDDEFEALLRGL